MNAEWAKSAFLTTLPREQEDFIMLLRNRGSLVPDNGSTGWVPMDTYSLNMRITEMESLGIIHPGTRMLDLGAGCGTSTLIFAFRGYHAVGIELNWTLAEIGQQGIVEAASKGLLKSGSAVIYHGSYYPEEYIERRQHGQTRALECENIIRSTHYHPICDFDVQKRYNLSYTDYDFWYIWAWQEQTFSVVEMFVDYAKSDAVLLLFNGANFPETLGAKYHQFSHCVVMKKNDSLPSTTVIQKVVPPSDLQGSAENDSNVPAQHAT